MPHQRVLGLTPLAFFVVLTTAVLSTITFVLSMVAFTRVGPYVCPADTNVGITSNLETTDPTYGWNGRFNFYYRPKFTEWEPNHDKCRAGQMQRRNVEHCCFYRYDKVAKKEYTMACGQDDYYFDYWKRWARLATCGTHDGDLNIPCEGIHPKRNNVPILRTRDRTMDSDVSSTTARFNGP
jgi:hypothetical protein